MPATQQGRWRSAAVKGRRRQDETTLIRAGSTTHKMSNVHHSHAMVQDADAPPAVWRSSKGAHRPAHSASQDRERAPNGPAESAKDQKTELGKRVAGATLGLSLKEELKAIAQRKPWGKWPLHCSHAEGQALHEPPGATSPTPGAQRGLQAFPEHARGQQAQAFTRPRSASRNAATHHPATIRSHPFKNPKNIPQPRRTAKVFRPHHEWGGSTKSRPTRKGRGAGPRAGLPPAGSSNGGAGPQGHASRSLPQVWGYWHPPSPPGAENLCPLQRGWPVSLLHGRLVGQGWVQGQEMQVGHYGAPGGAGQVAAIRASKIYFVPGGRREKGGTGQVTPVVDCPKLKPVLLLKALKGCACGVARPALASGPRAATGSCLSHYSASALWRETSPFCPPKPDRGGHGGEGSNRCDMGLNSGSWQQGHSATYNYPVSRFKSPAGFKSAGLNCARAALGDDQCRRRHDIALGSRKAP
ncbi:hypothetical protein H6P81_021730 [Aristolochia fimbriata]|uniref:Uncharacterized protein n=1 Tax=Aristolochia fimbriata TaxID=158543 RepID=A0AAV7DP47_ARIFI|nr:hypothetical protein H6P81_021730 [Aristolochia fimbriata]